MKVNSEKRIKGFTLLSFTLFDSNIYMHFQRVTQKCQTPFWTELFHGETWQIKTCQFCNSANGKIFLLMGEILPNFVCWLFDCQSALHNRKSKSNPIGNSWPQSGLKRPVLGKNYLRMFYHCWINPSPWIKLQYFGGTVQQQFWSGGLFLLALKRAILSLIPFSTDIIMWKVERNHSIRTRICHTYSGISKCKVCKVCFIEEVIFSQISHLNSFGSTLLFHGWIFTALFLLSSH